MEEEQGTYVANSVDIEDALPELPDPEEMELPALAYLTISDPPLPEAGGVAWIDLYGVRYVQVEDKTLRKVFKISLTCRATSPIAALDSLKQAIDHAEKQYKLLPYQ
jgi:hypothetical protein